MFLDEIEKDEIEYAKVCTEKVKEYLIKFFGEENRYKIEERIENTPMIFVDNKVFGYKTDSLNENNENSQTNDTKKDNEKINDVWLSQINRQIKFIYQNWFKQSFEGVSLKDNVSLNDLKQFEQFIFEKDFDNAKQQFKFLTGNDNISKKLLLQSEKLFIQNFQEDVDKFETLKIKMHNELYNQKVTIHDKDRGFWNNKFVKNLQKQNPKIRISLLVSMNNSYLNFLSNSQTSFGRVTNLTKHVDDKYYPVQYAFFNDMRILNQDVFVHELLHVISSSLKFVENEKGELFQNAKYGIEQEIKNLSEKFKKISQENRFLNEVLTDYFAVNITKQMFDDGETFLMNKTSNSLYSLCFVLIQPLFDKYYEELKFCYLSDNIENFENLFGKENVEKLNELVEDFSGYSQTYRDKEIPRCETFEEGLRVSALPESPFVLPVINKYNNCFKRMADLMQNIEEYQKFSLNKKTNEEINKKINEESLEK